MSPGFVVGRHLAPLVLVLLFASPALAGGQSPDTPTSSDDPQPSMAASAALGVSGYVLCRSGEPLGGVVVLVRSTGGPVSIPDLANATDADGHYYWSLPPGTYEMTFVKDGTTIAERGVAVPVAGQTARLDVVVEDCSSL